MHNLLRKSLLIALGLVTLSAQASTAPTPTTINPTGVVAREFTAQPFNTIDVSGPVSVQIFAGGTQPHLQLSGDSTSIGQTYAAVREGILYLGMSPTANKDGHVTARVYVPQLALLRVTGSGNVSGNNLTGAINVATSGGGTVLLLGKDLDLQNLTAYGTGNVHILGIKSSLLNIDHRGNGNVNLAGDMVLQNVNFNGNGTLSVEWINTTKVNINGTGQGRIFIAGNADLIGATLNGRAYLDAKYLRAKKGFINTTDNARADVWVQDNLNTLATGNSNIFYYRDSQNVASYMQPRGVSLRTTGLSDPSS